MKDPHFSLKESEKQTEELKNSVQSLTDRIGAERLRSLMDTCEILFEFRQSLESIAVYASLSLAEEYDRLRRKEQTDG